MSKTKVRREMEVPHKGGGALVGWDGLILAAASELQRIEQRAGQLKVALEVFKKRKQAGDFFVGAENAPSTLSKSTNGWDRAIADAKKSIDRLQTAINVFEKKRAAGEPWPGESVTQRKRK